MSKELDTAREEIVDSMLGLCDFKITVPLSEKTRNIRTDTFIYLEPLDFMSKIDNIYNSLTNKSGVGCRECKLVPYRKGYWYVKGVSIKYDTEQTMTLTLVPLPTIYKNNYTPQTAKTTATSKTKSKKTNTKENTSKIKAPSWLSKSDQAWAVKTVLKAIGSKKTKLQQAKAIYNYFKDHYGYSFYYNLQRTSPKGNRENGFNKHSGNCADGANILETLFLTAGLNARIKHPPDHYIIKLKIDGKIYWCDNRSTKAWNTVWRGITSNNEANIVNGVYIAG